MLKQEVMKKSFSFRQVISIAVPVYMAFMFQYIYTFSSEYWMVLAAFLVSQTTCGTPLRQGMMIFLNMAAAIIISSLLVMSIHHAGVIYFLVSILFMSCSYWAFMNRPQSSKMYFISLLFAISLLIATFSPNVTFDMMTGRIFDAAIGALIAMLCSVLIFSTKWDVEFSSGILPILTAMNEYACAITSDKNITEKRQQVEHALLTLYPSWIYETGFNRGLRSGFRFFLIHVERVSEVLFSMDDIRARGLDRGLMRELQASIDNVMRKNQELLTILSEYFMQVKISNTNSDFTSDITEFEKAVQRALPDNMSILSVSPMFLQITAFVRDIKDLRGLLLQLVAALPVKDGVTVFQEIKT